MFLSEKLFFSHFTVEEVLKNCVSKITDMKLLLFLKKDFCDQEVCIFVRETLLFV